MKRVFLFVLDSLGVGEMPDAAAFGDKNVNTLGSCAATGQLKIPNLCAMGLGNIPGIDYLPKAANPTAAYGRLAERSQGKDTTIGHWEIAGIVSREPLPTYPNGFPEEVLEPFRKATGRGVLANAPWSGTAVIEEYGAQHLETGDLIVYTSADSVFQIAAHEDVVPVEQLYEYCRMARKILQSKHGVGRVIARPFIGTPGNFTRTANRHDFSLEPPTQTLLDAVTAAGLSSIAVGKIHDIFAGRGTTDHVYNQSNAHGMAHAMNYADRDFAGLCFINLVDFDSQYGHRRDPVGYARALNAFDSWLPGFLEKLGDEDLVIITADHGCDPSYLATTDHTREYVPLLVWGKTVQPVALGTRESFADIAATVAQLLNVAFDCPGKSFAGQLQESISPEALMECAREAMTHAYAPYSGFQVGAALLCADGTVYRGCNIENAAFGPTNCAERTAFFKAIYDGHREFTAIAICGGKDGIITDPCPPCGVCRQVMREFCADDFQILLCGADGVLHPYTLAQLLPQSFSPNLI